jgi:hypothetical protein
VKQARLRKTNISCSFSYAKSKLNKKDGKFKRGLFGSRSHGKREVKREGDRVSMIEVLHMHE